MNVEDVTIESSRRKSQWFNTVKYWQAQSENAPEIVWDKVVVGTIGLRLVGGAPTFAIVFDRESGRKLDIVVIPGIGLPSSSW